MKRTWVALLLLSALLAAACGSRVPEEVLAQQSASEGSGGDQQAGVRTTGATGSSAGGAAETPGTTGSSSGGSLAAGGGGGGSTGATTGGSAGGDATGGTGGTGGTDAGGDASSCGQGPTDAPGVTDSEITVAAIVTDSGPLPGATAGSFRGAAAYFAMINAMGGVCGREIKVLKGDDGLDPSKARAEFQRLEPQVLAFVGQFAVADSGYIDLLEETGVPHVPGTVDPSGADLRNVVPKTARGEIHTGPFVWLKQQHPDVNRAAVLWADVGGVESNVPGYFPTIERAGFDLIYDQSLSVAKPDYTAEVRQAQDENIEFLYCFACEVNMHVRLVRNMRQQGYNPPIKLANIAYNSKFSELLGTDGDGWRNHQIHRAFLTPRDQVTSETLGQFMDWNERLFPGAQLDLFPVSGWGAASYFVKALRLIEGPITRESVLDALYRVERYDAGGMEVEIHPTRGETPSCFQLARHVDGAWTREQPPGGGFDCETGELFQWQ